MEPYDPVPGKVPRKVAIDRRKKEYASFSIEQLLAETGLFLLIQESTLQKREKSHGYHSITSMIRPLTTIPTKDGFRKKLMRTEMVVLIIKVK